MSPYRFKKLLQKVTKHNLILLVKRFIIVSLSLLLLLLIMNFIFPLPDKIDYSTVITDSQGNIIHAYLSKDQKWRLKTELTEISPLLNKTIVAKEDKYFYYHPGVNLFSVMRAAVMNVMHLKRTSGASTITMQVARAMYPAKRTFTAKCIETFRAFQLELKYSKKEILQLYLNLVPYGGNIEGVKAASLLYFNKNPDHLSLAEITALSVIPNKPSSLIIGKTNEIIIRERNKWLLKFATAGVFSKKEITDALAEPLFAKRNSFPQFIPHLALKLKNQLPQHYIKANINLNTQLKIEQITSSYIQSLNFRNIHNASVIIIDNRTHKVIAYVGSADFKDTLDGSQVNGATAVREPGSTLKPLLYGMCIDEGFLTPKFIINDVPVNYSGYAPENYDQKFNGPVTLENALEHSLNIPAVKSLKKLGEEKFINKLITCDFKQIKKDRKKLGLSLILGGCGANLEELTGLFSALANNGVYVRPQYFQSNDSSNKIKLLSTAADYMITEMLSKVNRPDFPINWNATEHLPKISWKTGTSYGRKDAWSIGYNKNYTVGVWTGNFSGQSVSDLSGANIATPLLFRIFNTIDYNNDGDWYAPPEDCNIRQVCSETGLPPGPGCTNIISDYYIPLSSTTTVCHHLQEIKISPDSSISYCSYCAPSIGYIKRTYRMLDPELQEYYIKRDISFRKIPPHNPECERVFKGEGPLITSPVNGNEYYINSKDPEPILLTARPAIDVAKLYWYINDQFYKTTTAGQRQFFTPKEGPVKISCTDDKGRNRNIMITVKYAKL